MVTTTRDQLDKLQRAQRWAVAWAVLGVAIFLAAFSTILYVVNAPGKSREVLGTVISFETHAHNDDLRVSTVLHIRLDDGNSARATIGPHVFAKPGSRVRLKATKMPILGIERHSFIGFENESGVLDKILR